MSVLGAFTINHSVQLMYVKSIGSNDLSQLGSRNADRPVERDGRHR